MVEYVQMKYGMNDIIRQRHTMRKMEIWIFQKTIFQTALDWDYGLTVRKSSIVMVSFQMNT